MTDKLTAEQAIEITQQVLRAVVILLANPQTVGDPRQIATRARQWSTAPDLHPLAARMLQDLADGLEHTAPAPKPKH